LLKDLRNRINKKINKNYNQRQKLISEIKQALDIDFNKISVYSSEINIFPNSNNPDSTNDDKLSFSGIKTKSKPEGKSSSIAKQGPMFRIDLPDSPVGSQRFYYNDVEINTLSINALNSLKKELDYILKEIEKEIDRLLI
jgi:hypothetical protein